jgi:hypothetical protein
MFSYSPQESDQSGRILGGAYANAAQTTADANVKLADDIGSSIVSLATAYGASKAQAAELEGYDEVFKMHAPQMGIGGEDLDRFLKMPNQQRRAAYTSLYENYMPHRQRMEYLNTQASSFGGRGGATGGAGGAAPRESFTF